MVSLDSTFAYCEFAMLYGIQRQEQLRLAADKQRLRVLISYGEYWFPWYMAAWPSARRTSGS